MKTSVATVMTGAKRLVRSPRVLPFEPLSCWLGRLALSQGASLREMAEFLALELRSDVDLGLSAVQFDTLAEVCSLETTSFDLPRRIFGALRRIAPDGEPFVCNVRGRARFRYCRDCLASFPTPYFQLHWRFVAWRHCPIHDCLLEDRCPHCGASIYLPADQVNAGPNRSGIALLSLCLRCGKALTDLKACPTVGFVSLWQRRQMSNGRAVLAALYAGRVKIQGQEEVFGLRKLLEVQRIGLVPSHFGWLSPTELRAQGAA